MKKVVFILFLLTSVMSAEAQGTWKEAKIEGDELKGIEASTAYVFNNDSIGSFIFWSFDEFQFSLFSVEQFNTVSGYDRFFGRYNGIEVLVGIYDDEGALVDKYKMWLDTDSNRANRQVRTRNAGGMSNPVGQKKKVKKIFNTLKSGHGYIRIVASRYHRSDFDLKITPFKINE